jgi:hypothetical protein
MVEHWKKFDYKKLIINRKIFYLVIFADILLMNAVAEKEN